MMRWVAVACLVVASSLGAQCLPGAGAHAAAVVRQRQGELLLVKVPEMSTDVPVPVRGQIVHLKQGLVEAVDAELRCAPRGEDAAAMQARLVKLLGANVPEKPFVPQEPTRDGTHEDIGSYGGELKVAVSAGSSAAAQMRVVTVSFGIECGDDAMLLIYEIREGAWRRTLRWQSPEYAEISGAFGDFFEYAVMLGTPWKIAVAHGTDWCTSRWSGFKIDLLAPGKNIPVVWHNEHGYVRESNPRLMAKPDGFELRADVGTIESGQMVRKGVFRYRVMGDRVERVAPIAVDGRGFVDEWLQIPWSVARRFTVVEGGAGFEHAHDAFTQGRNDAKVSYTYGPVRGCSVKGRYEVEMDADPGGPQFYAIEERPGGYTMVNFGTTQDERCSGPDLMKGK